MSRQFSSSLNDDEFLAYGVKPNRRNTIERSSENSSIEYSESSESGLTSSEFEVDSETTLSM